MILNHKSFQFHRKNLKWNYPIKISYASNE